MIALLLYGSFLGMAGDHIAPEAGETPLAMYQKSFIKRNCLKASGAKSAQLDKIKCEVP